MGWVAHVIEVIQRNAEVPHVRNIHVGKQWPDVLSEANCHRPTPISVSSDTGSHFLAGDVCGWCATGSSSRGRNTPAQVRKQLRRTVVLGSPPARFGPRVATVKPGDDPQEDGVMAEPTLYERLGGIFAIAAVIDNFSDRLVQNPKIVNANPELREWHTVTYHTRMPRPEVGQNPV
jgi:hypothetical protein